MEAISLPGAILGRRSGWRYSACAGQPWGNLGATLGMQALSLPGATLGRRSGWEAFSLSGATLAQPWGDARDGGTQPAWGNPGATLGRRSGWRHSACLEQPCGKPGATLGMQAVSLPGATNPGPTLGRHSGWKHSACLGQPWGNRGSAGRMLSAERVVGECWESAGRVLGGESFTCVALGSSRRVLPRRPCKVDRI